MKGRVTSKIVGREEDSCKSSRTMGLIGEAMLEFMAGVWMERRSSSPRI